MAIEFSNSILILEMCSYPTKPIPALDASHPIMTCSEAMEWESKLLKNEDDAWQAMNKVGCSLGRAIFADHCMSRQPSKDITALVFVGKGHNGGDALLAARELARIDGFIGSLILAIACPLQELKPNTKRAFDLLEEFSRLEVLAPSADSNGLPIGKLESLFEERIIHLSLDGLLGMQFRPPLRGDMKRLVDRVNATTSIACRASVDMPTGLGDESDVSPLRADFTYATGIFKKPLLESDACGTIRYLDIGFFEQSEPNDIRVTIDRILDPLRLHRPAKSEKRLFGHLAIIAGSRSMPGALAMSVHAALKSGVGLVTAFAPESIVAKLAPTLPEAMWRPWPETPEGGLALEGLWQVKTIADRATALLMGPGIGRERETQTLLTEILNQWEKPVLLDADALQPTLIESLSESSRESAILTPHDGEFGRLLGDSDTSLGTLREYAAANRLTVVQKGSSTRIANDGRVFVNTTGNPVLSRGGSGDLLAGVTAGLLAQWPESALESALAGVYWHGKAADHLARAQGQTSVRTTDLLRCLSVALEPDSIVRSKD